MLIVEQESEEVEVPKTPGGLFAGFGTRKVKLGGDDPDSAEPARAGAGTRRWCPCNSPMSTHLENAAFLSSARRTSVA